MTVQTQLLRETERGSVYRVSFPAPPGGRRGAPGGPAPAQRALEFTVTPEGSLGFDNRQPDARLCARPAVSRLLAEEMARTARERVPGALTGRSQRGLARELRLHRRAYALGVLRRHSGSTEAGSVDPAAPDYDSNALWFERPIRGLPALLKALFSR